MEKTNKNLVKALCEFNKCEPLNLADVIRRNYSENLNFIKSGVLRTTHLKYNITICPDFITNRKASCLFSHRGFKKITVDQYYFIKHNLVLRYPYLPCIAVKGGGTHKNYFPLEIFEFFDIEDLKLN